MPAATPKPPAAKTTQANQIAIRDEDIKGALVEWKPNLEFFAPARINVNAWLQTALLCISDTQKLRDALTTEKGKKSLIHALKYGISTGLSLNPQEGKAALVPFGEEIVFMPMKNGLCEMALETGVVDAVSAEIVRENDDFTIKKSSRGDEFEFSPARKNRGGVDGYFAYVAMKDGKSFVKYMTVPEVEEWRDTKVPKSTLYHAYDDKWNPPKFKKGDINKDSFWWKNPDAAGLKTVTKILLNGLHIPSIDKALEQETGLEDTWRNVTPPKGTSATDLGDKLKQKAEARRENPEPEEAETRTIDAEVSTVDKGSDALAPGTGTDDLDLGLDLHDPHETDHQSAPVALSRGPAVPPKLGPKRPAEMPADAIF